MTGSGREAVGTRVSAAWLPVSRAVIGVVVGSAILTAYEAADDSNGQLAFAAFIGAMLLAGVIAG